MKVKLHRDIFCPDGNFEKGTETSELSLEVAQGLVSGGYAEEIKELSLEVAQGLVSGGCAEKIKENQEQKKNAKLTIKENNVPKPTIKGGKKAVAKER